MIRSSADIKALTKTFKPRQQVRAGASAGGVVSSSTLPSRDSAAGSALAMVNVMDILDLTFRAQALGDKGQGCEGGFAIVICTMPVTCAKRAWLVSELQNSSNSGCVHLEHMAGTPAAQYDTIGSITGRFTAKNKSCTEFRTSTF